VEGVVFTETNKESMATALKEIMRSVECPSCGWSGYIEALDGSWRTTCINQCTTNQGTPQTLISKLHIPYDPELLNQLNAPSYQLSKTGKISYNHPEGTHDDMFWALALAAKQATMNLSSVPLAKI
jgi:hypothetical protein